MCITEEIKCKNGITGYFDDIDVCFLIFLCLCENCREIRQSLITYVRVHDIYCTGTLYCTAYNCFCEHAAKFVVL